MTKTVVEVAAGLAGGVLGESSVIVNVPLARGPGDAMTLSELFTMSIGVWVTADGFVEPSLMPVNWAVPKLAKADCWLFTVGASSIHSAELPGPLYCSCWVVVCPDVRSVMLIVHVVLPGEFCCTEAVM